MNASLTSADCVSGASGGKVGVCHASGPNKFVHITVSTSGCLNGHATHAGDFVSADPACVRCIPTTCAAAGKNCGSIPDGCGATVACGSCSGSDVCGLTQANVCGTPSRNCEAVAWRLTLGSAGANEVATAVATDGDGNAYVTGLTQGFDYSPPGGVYDPSRISHAFLAKVGVTGTVLWVREFGEGANAQGFGVATSATGKVYVVGPAVGPLLGSTGPGEGDAFIVQYDFDGNLGWAREFGTSTYDAAYGVATAPDGSAYVVGDTTGSLDGTPNSLYTDIFAAKFDGNGSLLWAHQLESTVPGGRTSAAGRAVTADSGGVYVTGWSTGTFDGHPNMGGLFQADLVLAKFGPGGTKLWSLQDGTTEDDRALAITADGTGNVYVAGSTLGTFPGNPGAGSGAQFVLKYDGNGNRLWARVRGASSGSAALGVASDGGNGIFVTGYTPTSLDGQPTGGDGDQDPFLIRYDTAGTWISTEQDVEPGDELGMGVAAAASGSVFVVGGAIEAIDVNRHRSYDALVTKLTPAPCPAPGGGAGGSGGSPGGGI